MHEALAPEQFDRMRPEAQRQFGVLREAARLVRERLGDASVDWFTPEVELGYDPGVRQPMGHAGAQLTEWITEMKRRLRDACATDAFAA